MTLNIDKGRLKKKTEFGTLSQSVDVGGPSFLLGQAFPKKLRKKLLAGTLPANNKLFAGTLPANNKLFAGTLPDNSKLFAGTLPANNNFLMKLLLAGTPKSQSQHFQN